MRYETTDTTALIPGAEVVARFATGPYTYGQVEGTVIQAPQFGTIHVRDARDNSRVRIINLHTSTVTVKES